jgi:hypothetical protein
MEEFFSPSTRLELLRFKHWEEWSAEVARESIGPRPASPTPVPFHDDTNAPCAEARGLTRSERAAP